MEAAAVGISAESTAYGLCRHCLCSTAEVIQCKSWTISSINIEELHSSLSAAVTSPWTLKSRLCLKDLILQMYHCVRRSSWPGLLLLGNLASAHISDLAHRSHFPDDIRAVKHSTQRSSQVTVYKLTG